MVAISSFASTGVAIAAFLVSGVASAPTPTSGNDIAAAAYPAPGATHSVVVGRAGLNFDPENIVASVGDVIEYHFLAKNHSVAQSSFSHPCQPIDDNAFFSGFMPTPEGSQNPNVFTIKVTDTKPIWFYCSQTNGNHCQSGMSGVINQNFDGPNTLAAYKRAAALTGPSISPAHVQGGVVGPNPNPLSGF